MSQDSQRFAIDERRWRELVVPSVLAGDVVLPRYDDDAPMGALELLVDGELPTGVVCRPEGWSLAVINDDAPELSGVFVNVRPTGSPLDRTGVMLSAGWLEWKHFLPSFDQLEQLDALPPAARLVREAELLREAIDTIISVANGLLGATVRQRRAAALGEVVLRLLPDELSDAQLARFAQALAHSPIGLLVAECLAGLDTDAGAGS